MSSAHLAQQSLVVARVVQCMGWRREEAGSRLPLRHWLPADRRGHMPVLSLVAPGHLAVAKAVHPATPGILDTAHILQAFPACWMRHHRIREMAPGACPFGILPLQPTGVGRVLVFRGMW